MRILTVTPCYPPDVGGAERYAQLVVEGLAERGHEVAVLAQRPKRGELDADYPVWTFRRPHGMHLWPEAVGIPVMRAARRHRPAVVLSIYAYPTGYAAAWAKRWLWPNALKGVPIVTVPMGGDTYPHFHGLRKPRVRDTIRKGYARADRVIAISGYLEDRLREICGDAPGSELPKVDRVPAGIDQAALLAELEHARQHPPDPLPINGPYVLHLARVAPVKRHDLAVAAVARVADRFRAKGLTYAIVGDGNAMADVRRQVEDAGVGDVVKLLGTRTGVDRAWLLGQCAFMVSTSREEGLPNVALEAMACGNPLLASDIPPHREVLDEAGDGQPWGAVFEAGSAEGLAAKLREMLDADLQPMRARALALRPRHTRAAMVEGFEKVLIDAVG